MALHELLMATRIRKETQGSSANLSTGCRGRAEASKIPPERYAAPATRVLSSLQQGKQQTEHFLRLTEARTFCPLPNFMPMPLALHSELLSTNEMAIPPL